MVDQPDSNRGHGTGLAAERLHCLGAPEVFLALRGSHGLRSLFAAPLPMRIPRYKVETVANPARPFDALNFINVMKPATSIQKDRDTPSQGTFGNRSVRQCA